jgi:hypothetical protein
VRGRRQKFEDVNTWKDTQKERMTVWALSY